MEAPQISYSFSFQQKMCNGVYSVQRSRDKKSVFENIFRSLPTAISANIIKYIHITAELMSELS